MMDFSYVFEFLQLKNFTLAVEFQIELKEFKQFSRHLKTDKYISTTEWETIIRKIEDAFEKFNKCHRKRENNFGEFTTDDESLAIEWKFRPREECCINFDKLNFRNCFDWIMHIKVRRAQLHNILDQKPHTPDLPGFLNSDNEYNPTSSSNLYKASKKSDKNSASKNVFPSSEYSPQPVRSPDRNKKGTYTPSKIGSRSKNRSATKKGDIRIFESSDDDDEDDVEKKIAVTKISVGTKRKLYSDDLQLPNIEKTATKKTTKKLKTGSIANYFAPDAKNQPNSKPKATTEQQKLSQKTKKPTSQGRTDGGDSNKNSNLLSKISDEDVMRMNKFTEDFKRQQQETEERRQQLQNVEIVHFQEIPKTKLKWYIDDFAATIKQFYANAKRQSSRKRYDPVLMTTSNILSDSQITYVMKQVELLKTPEERNRNDELFTSTVLPEFLIHVYRKEQGLNYEEAVERIKLQDEKRTLFNESG